MFEDVISQKYIQFLNISNFIKGDLRFAMIVTLLSNTGCKQRDKPLCEYLISRGKLLVHVEYNLLPGSPQMHDEAFLDPSTD